MQELVEGRRLDAGDRRLLVDDAFLDHVDGDLQRRRRGALARSRLQHVELALLHRELDILHVAVMRLQLARSEEHTSELQSLMRISYAVFCLKKKKSIYE